MKNIAKTNLPLLCGALAALLMSAGAAQASVEISTAATKNMACNSGVCSPTAKKAVLNVNDLTNMLAAGDVKVTTGNGAVTITIAAPFSWTSTHRLTLDAYYNVSFRAPVTVAGQGGVTITYNDGGSGGDLLFFPGAKVDFWDTSSSLVVNGMTYTLETSIDSLASAISANPSGRYAFANDYAAGTYHQPPVLTAFTGTFEGLGHDIDGMRIEAVDERASMAFFDDIETGGIVRDLIFSHAVIWQLGEPNVGAVGVLAAVNNGTVQNVQARVRVSGKGGIGGLVGWNSGSVISCVTSGKVKGRGPYPDAGGLLGVNTGSVTQSSSSASATGTTVGGLIGANEGTVLRSFASGEVVSFASYHAEGPSAGGLVGWNTGSIDQAFATGGVTGGYGRKRSFAGGLVGRGSGNVSNSYAEGAAVVDHSPSTIGGFEGGGDVIVSSYSLGPVSGGKDSKPGGFLGTDAAAGTNSAYWDIDTSGTSVGCGAGSCAGVVGLSDAQLKSALPAGFDRKIWGQKPTINNGYPYLLANPPPQ